MLRALHLTSHTGLLRCARRLSGSLRGRLMLATRWLVTVLLLWLILRAIDTGAVVGAIRRAGPVGLSLAGLVVAVQFVVLVWRWQLVVRILRGEAVGLGPLSLFLGHSLLIGQMLPSSVGGDLVRTVMLARVTGAAIAARSVVCDRLLGFVGLAFLAAPAFPIIAARMGGLTPSLTLTIAALGTMLAVGLVLGSPSLIHGLRWLGRPLATVVGDLRLTLCSGKVSLAVLAVAVGSNLLAVLLIYVLGRSVGADLRALDCLVLAPPALLASAMPISLGGWGVREGALLAAFSLVHADLAGVAATSVMFGLTTPLTGAIVAGASLFGGARDVLPGGSE